MRSRKIAFELFCFIFILVGICTFLWAGRQPGEMVKKTTDTVLTILKDSSLKGTEKIEERRQKIWDEISLVFDFEEMAKRAMGRFWKDRSLEEKKEFIDLFSYLIQDAYIGKINTYSDETVVYLGEKQEGRYATVLTKIVPDTGTDITVDYRLLDEQGEWRVYDVVIEGVSLVNNYRSQFNKILVKSSYKKLVEKLKQKKVEQKASAK